MPRGRPWVMGVLNVTPDSFSDGGLYLDSDEALRRAERMVEEGADLIDIGGESTRPGAVPVSVDEELRRVVPVIRAVAKRLPVPLSIDTSKAEVAQRAIEAGASMVNDVTALQGDPRMSEVAARARLPVILMHMRGAPRTMQQRPRYRDVVGEVAAFLAQAIRRAECAGISSERILIDPGLGFGKTLSHNLLLLRHLDAFRALGKPVVLGPSRKSFIGRLLDVDVPERLEGTLACVAYAAEHEVDVVRVHDVQPAVQLLTVWSAITHASRSERRPRRHRAPSAAWAHS